MACRLLTCRAAHEDPTLAAMVARVADEHGRPFRPLHLQALLQLPRIADDAGRIDLAAVEGILHQLAEELPPADEWIARSVDSPRDLGFVMVPPTTANEVMERFHYLRSPRRGGRAYGLAASNPETLLALVVSSPLDVPYLEALLVRAGKTYRTARVFSRVFAFDGAPRNSLSYLISRAMRAEADEGVTELVTYVNPNLGFTGASYRASGWSFLGEEPGTTYRYLHDRYITDRELVGRFGDHTDEEYRIVLGSRFAVSRVNLSPLLLFHCDLGPQ